MATIRHIAIHTDSVVLQMVSNGAQLFPEDVDTITKYFAAYLGPDVPASATQ
jgi:hypothetical protein